ncbi:class I SAM-dependent methyltransferase [Streptomyces sp. SCA3-4]|uniref:class I SAM-dependent methyltransferase n=1 Tax=Streptomyces sichuanensis TaxID=2871810 RepID=UPI001CE2CBCF|nr:class I SAM-dependent methyltransferase [Streptomyces sichuanensis]MCA6090958.1 class I SAM-dependent methyltransferase [Streptomyces sichuanensis]
MSQLALIDAAPVSTGRTLPGIQPFSILRTDLGPWRDRRRAWEDLGLHSRRGRDITTFNTAGSFGRRLADVNGGLSTFDPVLAEASYTWYCPDGGQILDPFAGGSVRGLVAANGGFRYTGIDLSPVQIDANEEAAADWRTRDLLATEPRWIHGDALEELPELPTAHADYVFTCPPYHDLERYSDHPADLSAMRWREFAEAYRAIIAETVRCLAPHRFATWVVGEVRNSTGTARGLMPLTIAAHEAAGARLYNDAILVNTLGTVPMRLGAQWRASRKHGRHHQYVLTFVKGDPRKATAALSTP